MLTCAHDVVVQHPGGEHDIEAYLLLACVLSPDAL